MDANSFEIKLPQFEGPFDLLLFFIERDELDIHNIPIAHITDDFLEYIHKLNAMNMELASEFIFVAATLMRIKAKMLLPRPDLNEEGDEIDIKGDLINKLIEYKKFKQASAQLQILEQERSKQERRGNISYDLQEISLTKEAGEELTSFSLYKLMLIYERVIKRYGNQYQEDVHTVLQYPYTIESQKQAINDLMRINQKLDFKGLASLSDNKIHFVYNFLALLEMLQQELISIQTGFGFNNFWIEAKINSNSL